MPVYEHIPPRPNPDAQRLTASTTDRVVSKMKILLLFSLLGPLIGAYGLALCLAALNAWRGNFELLDLTVLIDPWIQAMTAYPIGFIPAFFTGLIVASTASYGERQAFSSILMSAVIAIVLYAIVTAGITSHFSRDEFIGVVMTVVGASVFASWVCWRLGRCVKLL